MECGRLRIANIVSNQPRTAATSQFLAEYAAYISAWHAAGFTGNLWTLLLSGGVSISLITLLRLPVAVTVVFLPAFICYGFAAAAISYYRRLLWMGDLSSLVQFDQALGHHDLNQQVLLPFSQHIWQM